MKKLYYLGLLVLALMPLMVNAQRQKPDSIRADVIYYAPELENRYIIQMKTQPFNKVKIEKTCAGKYKRSSKEYKALREKLIAGEVQAIESEHKRFNDDLNLLKQKFANNASAHHKILREYKNAFNGFSIEADQSTINDIKKLPHVKKIVKDRKVKAIDFASNQVINVPQVWTQYGATGKNVRIGILDTGIDPNQPELSGKVMQGYDFVNNDSLAMDDHGHGTHCAGIAAANGPTLKGVAPDAKLVPIKVLDQWGYGSTSTVIAGINYAVDPDNNPLTDDGVDILNISLGGPGDPDDPISQAVNGAFDKGVLCVVAAGNDGQNYYTIGAPGCAKNALTVGASDNNNNLAYFSSCGPVKRTFDIKPDVLAPGVGIYSTLPNNQYASWDGTSMATPHVTGAAAVLKELHPEWTPADIKAALMQSARDIGVDIWKQGKGRIDVLNATQTTTVVSPGMIAFGNISDTSAMWTAEQPIKLHNLSGGNKNYSLSVSGNIPDGINFSYPHSVSLSDSANLSFSVSMNARQVVFPNTVPSYVKGYLVFKSNIDTIQIPFVINKANSVQFFFDRVPTAIIIHNNNDIKNTYYPTDSIFNYICDREGYYDIIACFDGFMTNVVKEQVYLKNNALINIKSTEAVNEITFKAVDQNGKQLPILSGGVETLRTKDRNMGLNLILIQAWWEPMTQTEIKRRVNNLSDKYVYDLTSMSYPGWNESHKYYSIPYELANGITNSQTISNSQNDFTRITRKFPTFTNSKKIYFARSKFSVGIAGNYDFFQPSYNNLEPDNTLTDYVLPLPSRNYPLNQISFIGLFEQKGDTPLVSADSLIYRTGNEVMTSRDTLELSNNSWFGDLIIPVSNKELAMDYRLQPLHYLSTLEISAGVLRMPGKPAAFTNAFCGALTNTIDYKLYKNNSIDTSGILINMSGLASFDYSKQPIRKLEPGNSYKMDLIFKGGMIDNFPSISTATHFLNTNFATDSRLNSLVLKGNGIITDHLKQNDNNTIEIASNCDIKGCYIKQNDDTLWREIGLTRSFDYRNYTNRFNGAIPKDLKYGYYALKIYMTTAIDTVMFKVEPGFVLYGKCDSTDNHIKVSIKSSDADNLLYNGESVTLTANGAEMYSWSTGEKTPVITKDTSGIYRVIGKNVNGCTDTASVLIIAKRPITITSSDSDNIICSGESVIFTATGASNYHWSTGEIGASITKTTSGTYTVTDGYGDTASVTLIVRSLPKVSIISSDSDNIVCQFEPMTLTASGASDYVWNGYFHSTTLNLRPYDSYKCVVVGTDDFGCKGTDSLMLTVLKKPNITVSSSDADNKVCFGDSIVFTASGADNYTWSTGETTTSITVKSSNGYMVTVTGTNEYGCSSDPLWEFYQIMVPFSVTGSNPNNIICKDNYNGGSDCLYANGADSYQWSNGSTDSQICVNTPGTYTVTGTSNFGCKIEPISITVNAVYPQVTINNSATIFIAAICDNESITLTASGLVNYSWSNGDTTSTITNALPGFYSLSGIDANGCWVNNYAYLYPVTKPDVFIVTMNNKSILCSGDSTALFATNAYEYLWSDGQTKSDIFAYKPGTYTVIGSNGGNCKDTASITLTESLKPTVRITSSDSDNIVCELEHVTLTATGASEYVWDGYLHAPTIELSPDFSYKYIVVGTNEDGCYGSDSLMLTVIEKPKLTVSSSDADNKVCFGDSIVFTASGADYFSWSTGETTSSVTVKSSDGILVKVTGTNEHGCISDTEWEFYQIMPPFSVTGSNPNNVICDGGYNNEACLYVYGANSYQWSNGSTDSYICVNTPGTYTVSGVSDIGCKTEPISTTVTLAEPPMVTVFSSDEDHFIFNGDSITFTASGASSYIWSTGETTPSIVPLETGFYTVTGTDSNGCQATSDGTFLFVYTPTNISIFTSTGNNFICDGDSVTLSAFGSTDFKWSTGETTPSITKTSSGTYTVTDRYGNTASVTLIARPAPTVTISSSDADNVICKFDRITLTASGASEYIWSDNNLSPSITFFAFSSSKYSVIGIDEYGCKGMDTLNLTLLEIPQITISSSDADNNVCFGDSIVFTASGANSYTWSTGETKPSIALKSYGFGEVTVTGTDKYGCQAGNWVTYEILPPFMVTSSDPDNIICDGDHEILTASGADSYKWSNGSTDPTLDVTMSGTYTVMGESNMGCKIDPISTTVTVVRPKVTISSSITGNAVCSGKSVTYKAKGSYNYVWSTGETSSKITVTQAGIYSVTGVDIYGCKATDSVALSLIANPGKPVITEINEHTLMSDAVTGNQWFKQSKGIIQGAVYQKYSPLKEDYYYVVVTVDGCSSEPSEPFHYVNCIDKEVITYPVPVGTVLHVSSSYIIESVKLTNVSGKILYHKENIGSTKTDIDMSGYRTGYYDLIVQLKDIQMPVIRKILKR